MRVFLLTLLSVLPLQAADNPVVNRLLGHWEKSKAYAIELAKQMPADQYASRPNDEEMTFGQQMVHIASGIVYMIKDYSPTPPPQFDPKKADKETAIADLTAAFDAGAAAIRKFSDADLLSKTVESEGQKMTAIEAIMLAFDHVEHHRGQAIVYLRYKGIKPVDYRF
jgi:uncharacterized damage-inducible protein DinB